MSFKAYVLGRRITDTPAGDFVSDVRRDPHFPDPQTWSELERYLRLRSVCDDAVLAAAKSVWNAYQRGVRNA